MSLISVVNKIGGQKLYGIEYSEEPTMQVVARILNKRGKTVGYLNMDENSKKYEIEIDRKKYDVEPIIPLNKERPAIIISGESGLGKSTIGAMYLEQYSELLPGRPMYLVSEKDKNIDRNLSQIKGLKQLTSKDIENFYIKNYEDCLFLFDDSDFGKNSKKVFEMLNLISTVGREYRIGYIFISHYNSRLTATKAYTEFQIYVTYLDNLANNRMLETHMGFPKKQIESFKNIASSYYVFNKIYNILITDQGVLKYR